MSSHKASDIPLLYRCSPFVSNPNAGTPVLFSISQAIPFVSVPIIIGTGLPITVYKVGFTTSPAFKIFSINLSSLPSTASISLKPEQNTLAVLPYHLGSSYPV